MVDARLAKVQESLLALEKTRDLASAKKVVRNVSALLVPSLSEDVDSTFRLFNDQDGKLKANAGWFFSDTTITDKLATYTLDTPAESNLDIKVFGVKKAKKGTISWAIGLTPNFEDEPFNSKFNVGIDFIIPESVDRVIVALSKNYVIRTLELKGQLTATFQEILNSWLSVTDLSRKAEFHEILWNSLDLSPINKKFYEGISQRFISLRQHIETSGALDHDHAAQFANRIIGRVIFTWFLDKKSLIEPSMKYFESEPYPDDTDYYREKLESLFFEVLNTPVSDRSVADTSTPYLNGGLFEPKPGDLYKDKTLTFPKNFFDDFLGFLRAYNFTTDESTTEFQQVAIDPEMLGRIFENLLAEVSDETGEQARKAKGAFYTPREIVDFMCKESLKSYLRHALPAHEDIERRLYQIIDATERDFQDQDHNWRRDLKNQKQHILEALDALRVIDPACGSGAFPMGMLQLLVRTYTRLEPRFDSLKSKLGILEKNIYGVDIEPMAIEISRLRAWLSLIVDSQDSQTAVKPLPNLDFKFICADSLEGLLELGQLSFGEDQDLDIKLSELRNEYFSTDDVLEKYKLRTKYLELVEPEGAFFEDSHRAQQLKSYRPFDSENSALYFDPMQMFGVSNFDVVIGNPPYVGIQGIDLGTKKRLERKYGFSDDLYSHFFFRGFELLAPNGSLAYISSKSFWTIQSKKNLRKLLLEKHIEYVYDTSNPFESAMVDTCIVMCSQRAEGSVSQFLTLGEHYAKPTSVTFDQDLFKGTVNLVIFPPTEFNLIIHQKFNDSVKGLVDNWWESIRTNTAKETNADELRRYTSGLKPGDVALLGTLADGGDGLTTGNNGRYIGVLSTSSQGQRVKHQRAKKLIEFLLTEKISSLGNSETEIKAKLERMAEADIFKFVEDLKDEHGRDILGKGFLYRLVERDFIAKVSDLSDTSREMGIESSRNFVPYDKGDRDGNSWFLPTPFFIDWSRESVKHLRESPASYVRNSKFYFKPGVCWIFTLNETSEYLKARLREAGVFDVNAKSLFVEEDNLISEKFLVCLLNSYFVFIYKKTFINNTSAFQINDARQLPVVIPTKEQLAKLEGLFDKASGIKSRQYEGKSSTEEILGDLDSLQDEVNREVLKLYGLEHIKALSSTD